MVDLNIVKSNIDISEEPSIIVRDAVFAGLAGTDKGKIVDIVDKAELGNIRPGNITLDKNGNVVITSDVVYYNVIKASRSVRIMDVDNHPCGINIICGSF